MNKYLIKNCKVYTGSEVINSDILIQNDKIVDIKYFEFLTNDIQIIDGKGLNFAPGFIDLQIYGGGGQLFSSYPDISTIEKTYLDQRKFGTTSFQITLSSTPFEVINRAIQAGKEYLKSSKKGLIGIHLEGPYFNIIKRGAHKAEYIRQANYNEIKDLIEKSKDVVSYMTIAPEIFDDATLDLLLKSNIIIAAGHSNATYKEALDFFNKGIKNVTHLFNAMSQFQSREPGLVGATYDTDVNASIIADGIHLDFASLRISKKIKEENLFLITDTVTEDLSGDYKFHLAGDRYVDENGILSGSALNMMQAVKNCVEKAGISLDESLRMASTYPAKVMGLEDKLGKLEKGFLADVVIFDNNFNVKGIIEKGVLDFF